MNTLEKVNELIDKQLKELSKPFRELTEIIANDRFNRYKAYDRAMDVDCLEHKIIFYRVKFLSGGREVEKEKLSALGHNGKTFVYISRNR